MFRLLLIVVYSSVVSASSSTVNALWNLESMCECRLHYRATLYNDYGCWCGIGGSGMPIDGIDSCCMHHDKCYDAAIDTGACYDVPYEYIDSYKWTCNGDGNITCGDNRDRCKAALCNCDSTVVDCWSQYAKPTRTAKCNRTIAEGWEDRRREIVHLSSSSSSDDRD